MPFFDYYAIFIYIFILVFLTFFCWLIQMDCVWVSYITTGQRGFCWKKDFSGSALMDTILLIYEDETFSTSRRSMRTCNFFFLFAIASSAGRISFRQTETRQEAWLFDITDTMEEEIKLLITVGESNHFTGKCQSCRLMADWEFLK